MPHFNSYCIKFAPLLFAFKDKKLLFYLAMMEYFQFSLVMFGDNSAEKDGIGNCMIMKCGRTVKIMFITGKLNFVFNLLKDNDNSSFLQCFTYFSQFCFLLN